MSETAADQRRRARIAQAQADIEAVDEQLANDELDPQTAETLVSRYRAEIEQLEREAPSEDPPKSLDRRRLVGTLLLVGAFVVVSVLALAAIRPRDGGFVTGDGVEGVNLDEVSNEQMEAVIAANAELPQVAAMEVALADRYFDEGAYSDALPHYLSALDGQLDSTRRARALARVGWMSFASGRADLAEVYLGEALETEPGYEESRLFLGLVLLNEGRPSEALAQLEPLLAGDALPDELRPEVEAAVELARSQVEERSG